MTENLFENAERSRIEDLANASGFKLRNYQPPLVVVMERDDCIVSTRTDIFNEPLKITKLKPCPFCGGKPMVIYSFYQKYQQVMIRCPRYLYDTIDDYPEIKQPFCRVNPCTSYCQTIEEAEDMWNRRDGNAI